MKAIVIADDGQNAPTDDEAWADLARPLGVPGAGMIRYAAAMQLWRRGLVDVATLERYRICSTTDGEDPARADPPKITRAKMESLMSTEETA
ncbi:MAG: hypothetical protein AAFQ75_12875 [Pseudomonadota bacterium]